VYYNADQGAFVGEGKEVESDGNCLEDISIEIRVPKILNFDSIDIGTEGTFCWEELSTSFRFVISNGPVFEEHDDIENSMETYVRESVTHILETHKDSKDEEIGWVQNDWSIRRESFKEDGDDLVSIIDTICFNCNIEKHQSYHISINE
jgi:hypothetical protein